MTRPTPLPAERLRWRCPLDWVAAPDLPDCPEVLWGRDDLLAELRAVATSGEHLALLVPSAAVWTEAVAAVLRSAGRDAVALHDGRVEALRGRGEPGDLAEADGRCVVLDPRDLVGAPWAAVREAMLGGTVRPQPVDGQPRPPRARARLQVVLVGSEGGWRRLKDADGRAEGLFARRFLPPPDGPLDARSVGLLAERLRRVRSAPAETLAWLVELAVGASRRGRLILEPSLLSAALREAKTPALTDVRAAWEALRARRRHQADFQRLRLVEGLSMVSTGGARVGVVNGLMVYGAGKHPYCMPGRITARVALGRSGVVNIEREAKLSGKTFDKGVFQLASLIRATFGQKDPLGIAVTLAFEQSQGTVDGDSATLAEAIALFSELSGLPARQDIAVTGSINHRGEVQPVGSVNRKVEGWWRACRAAGLTGEQGVLLPALNVPDLQLPEELLADVQAGRFSVYGVERLAPALELLLQRDLGRAAKPGANTILGRSWKRVNAMSARLFPPPKGNPGKGGGSTAKEPSEAKTPAKEPGEAKTPAKEPGEAKTPAKEPSEAPPTPKAAVKERR